MINGCKVAGISAGKGGKMDGWLDGWMVDGKILDGWMDGWMDKLLEVAFDLMKWPK